MDVDCTVSARGMRFYVWRLECSRVLSMCVLCCSVCWGRNKILGHQREKQVPSGNSHEASQAGAQREWELGR